MILGSLATIGLFSYYEGLIIITLIYRAGQHAVNGIISGNVTKAADGIAVFAVEGTLQIIFLRLFFAKHAEKLRRAIGFLRRKSRIKPVLDRC
jgi:hypothetical protein